MTFTRDAISVSLTTYEWGKWGWWSLGFAGETAKVILTVWWPLVNKRGLGRSMKMLSTILMTQIQSVETRFVFIWLLTLCKLFAHLSFFPSDNTFVIVWLHFWILAQGPWWNKSLFLFVSLFLRTHLLAWQTWVQHVTSTRFCKCGSTTWSCEGASISAIIPEHRSTILSLVYLKTEHWTWLCRRFRAVQWWSC